jgi:hypothetical protein
MGLHHKTRLGASSSCDCNSPSSVHNTESSAEVTTRCCVPKPELLSTVRDGQGLLEYLKRSPVLEDLCCNSRLGRDGGHVGSVLCPHKECLIQTVELRNKERAGLLLLRILVLRAVSEDEPSRQVQTGEVGNHRPWRSWGKAPSHTTKRQVLVQKAAS